MRAVWIALLALAGCGEGDCPAGSVYTCEASGQNCFCSRSCNSFDDCPPEHVCLIINAVLGGQRGLCVPPSDYKVGCRNGGGNCPVGHVCDSNCGNPVQVCNASSQCSSGCCAEIAASNAGNGTTLFACVPPNGACRKN
jgi:hypothetical protein